MQLVSTSPAALSWAGSSAKAVFLFLPPQHLAQCLARAVKYAMGMDAGQDWIPTASCQGGNKLQPLTQALAVWGCAFTQGLRTQWPWLNVHLIGLISL